MGLFDDVEDLDGTFKCPAGHIVTHLQTKDLECSMYHYILSFGKLYQCGQSNRTIDRSFLTDLTITYTDKPVFQSQCTEYLRVYGSCNECKLYTKTTGVYNWPRFETNRAWQEWRLHIVNGHVVEVLPVRNETLDDVRATLLKYHKPEEIFDKDAPEVKEDEVL